MKNIDIHTIFSESDCIPEKMLFDYQDNKLDNKERNIVEKHLANCEICSDALEGLALINNRYKYKRSIKSINVAVEKRTFKKGPKTISINMPTQIAIAATIAILIGISFLFTHYLRSYNNKIVADNSANKNIRNKNLIIPTLTASDSEITKEKSNENVDYFKKTPNKKQNIEKTFEGEKLNDLSIAEIIEQPKEIVSEGNSNGLVNTKTPVLFEKDLSKNTEVVKTFSTDMLDEETDTKPQLNTDKIGGGMNVKDDAADVEIVSKKQEKKNITSISDIVNNSVRSKKSVTPSAPTMQENSVVANETYDQAIEKFNAKDYNAAKILFTQILVNDNSNYNVLYYKSLCSFYLDENDNAIVGFNEIMKVKKGIYFDSAKWYKALTLIKKGEKKDAKKILEEIINSTSTFKTNAEQKIKEI